MDEHAVGQHAVDQRAVDQHAVNQQAVDQHAVNKIYMTHYPSQCYYQLL